MEFYRQNVNDKLLFTCSIIIIIILLFTLEYIGTY
jgi:hypothetical protein